MLNTILIKFYDISNSCSQADHNKIYQITLGL